jgi:hypothetical protein
MTRKFLIVTALVAGVAATANAQICNGTAPFTAGKMRVGGSAEFPDGGKVYGGEFAWGLNNGAYLGGTLARTSVDNTDINWMDFGANGGYEMRFESMPKIRVCPQASLSYGNGPDFAGADVHTLNYALGGSVGSVVSASENVAIVPSASLSWVGIRATAEAGGSSATASDSWAQARLAAGIVFNRAITVAPVVTIPFSDAGGDTRFGFAASYNFGRSGGVMQQGSKKKGKR